jgi:hypothetical protein
VLERIIGNSPTLSAAWEARADRRWKYAVLMRIVFGNFSP